MSASDYAFIGVAAFMVSTIAGTSGYGAGLMMPLFLIPLIGPQGVVPILAVAGVFNNASRLAAFRDRIYWRRVFQLVLTAAPFCLLGAGSYTLLSGNSAMLVIGAILILLVPVRRLLRGSAIGTSSVQTFTFGAVYGFLVGGTPGVGVILIPILLGMGLTGGSVIATDSAVALLVGLVKVATFQSLGFLPWEWWTCALVVGICGIPGAFLARWLTDRMSVNLQSWVLELGILAGGCVLVIRGLGFL